MSKNDPENMIYKAFKTKIYPTKEQIIYFKKCFGVARFTYNWMLYNKENYLNNNNEKNGVNYLNLYKY